MSKALPPNFAEMKKKSKRPLEAEDPTSSKKQRTNEPGTQTTTLLKYV